ncbi:Radical SAM domain protein [Acetivibrio thermocellus ATCC 27405]|uniref:Radical SAM domain protein n=1 Tax=Acetivibrio thermocellus (strain ATCC 27405 / DSM 1237 / JCM 9322 / NBRC 103400 / NCIMB 10682 / NRRL B-4536 / VPI 7372) TaxID=203119 RepID=A3DG31_ACET2|nr:radical SAM protein [Acetivibrio thermocellus]ABN52910.1 Radical SAM domain protein [Acetivibrio thermocellus ATCC 27405]
MERIMFGENLEFQSSIGAPLYVVLNITNKCNLRCLHCFNDSPTSTKSACKELEDDQIIKIVKELGEMKVANVCFSGGEPLVRKQVLFNCLMLLGQRNVRTSIVTNGTLIDEQTAEMLNVLGVKEVQVSLDGCNEDTHEKLRQVKGCFNLALKGIRNLCYAGVTTSVSYTLNKWNVNDVEPIIEKLEDMQISALNIRPLLEIGAAAVKNELRAPTSKDYRQVVKTINKYKRKGIGFQIGFNDPISHIYYYRENKANTVIEIQSDGNIFPSYCIPISVGNVKVKSLREYWDSGLNSLWSNKKIQEIAKEIYSCRDLSEIINKINQEDI